MFFSASRCSWRHLSYQVNYIFLLSNHLNSKNWLDHFPFQYANEIEPRKKWEHKICIKLIQIWFTSLRKSDELIVIFRRNDENIHMESYFARTLCDEVNCNSNELMLMINLSNDEKKATHINQAFYYYRRKSLRMSWCFFFVSYIFRRIVVSWFICISVRSVHFWTMNFSLF